MRAAARAIGVDVAAVSRWCKKEEAAGRKIHVGRPKLKRSAAPAAKPAVVGKPGVTPAVSGGPVPPPDEPTFTLEEIMATTPWGPEVAQRFLTLMAQRASRPTDQMAAATKLLDSRRKDGGGEGAHDAEWEALRRDPEAMAMLKEMAERRRAAEKQAG